jgi:hypothetical protein
MPGLRDESSISKYPFPRSMSLTSSDYTAETLRLLLDEHDFLSLLGKAMAMEATGAKGRMPGA